jgi:hypothetical protein
MEADFLPQPSTGALSQNDGRMTDAAEYMAYHLGQIDKKLDRLIAILEAQLQALPSRAQQAAPREGKLLPQTYPGDGLPPS